MHEQKELSHERLEDEELIFGPQQLKQEYKDGRYPEKHRRYIKRKIQESLQDGSVKIEDRKAMFANYEDLESFLERLSPKSNIIEAINFYFINATTNSGDKLRYPFANKMLTKVDAGDGKGFQYPTNGLGAHIQEVSDYGENVAFTKDGKYKLGSFFFEGETIDGKVIPAEHYAALLVDVVGPVHDILKFLGSLEAQIMPDHEIMTAALVRRYFEGRTVTLRGEDYVLTAADVEFVARVVEDHENIGDTTYLREQGRDKYASADNNFDRAKSLFFLMDTQTGVFEIDENGLVSINKGQLKKRFADLYFRHVARFTYDNETGQAIKTAKIFRPEWGAYALRDYIALFSELAESGSLEMPANWKSFLISTALEVLEESEKEHYELIEHGVAHDPESGDDYSFSTEDILRIRDTKIQLVKQLFDKENLAILDNVFENFFDQRSQLGAKVVYFTEQFLRDVIAEADIFSNDENQKERQEQLVAKILADPFTYRLDHLMHQEVFLDEAAKVANDGYNERRGYSNQEVISHQERSFNLAAFASLQETLGVLAEKTTKSQEDVLKSILEGTLSFEEWLTLVEAQKMSYLSSRLWNGEAFYREAQLFDQSSSEDRKEDWYQVLDNARLMAKWLNIEYIEADTNILDSYADKPTFIEENYPEFLEQVSVLLHPEYVVNFADQPSSDSQKNTIRELATDVTDKESLGEISVEQKLVMEAVAANGTELLATILGVLELANEQKLDPIEILQKLSQVKTLDSLSFTDSDLMARDVFLYKHLLKYKDMIWQNRELEMGLSPSGFSTVQNPNEEVQKLGAMAEKIINFINPV